ncbi:Uncharacterised protein [Mycobacteroides abscessus subsp. abscessus]|nr:Uncharacterised protein [Mycobacteroides abscessus subsp. abscessus]
MSTSTDNRTNSQARQAKTVAPATPLFRKDVSAASRIARRRATPAFEAGGTPEEY